MQKITEPQELLIDSIDLLIKKYFSFYDPHSVTLTTEDVDAALPVTLYPHVYSDDRLHKKVCGILCCTIANLRHVYGKDSVTHPWILFVLAGLLEISVVHVSWNN